MTPQWSSARGGRPGAYCEDMESPDPRLVPDRARPGAWIVRIDSTDQSYIDPDPTYLEFEYVQRIADAIDTTFPPGQRIMAVHVGGGGMTIPRYIAHTRPTSGQLVFEPDETLTQAVRTVAPLPYHSGIKVRPTDGRAGLAQLSDDYADLLVLDAFCGPQIPAELGTVEWFAEVRRVVRSTGSFLMNVTDRSPLVYARRIIAGIARYFSPLAVGTETATLKGRRFGNLVVFAGGNIDPIALENRAERGAFPYRILYGPELDRWLGHPDPFTDEDSQPSTSPFEGPSFFF